VRERLTLAFTGLALVILTVVVVVRAIAVENIVRTNEQDHLAIQADQAARVFDARFEAGESITREDLEMFTGDEMRLTVVRPGRSDLSFQGAGFTVGDLGEPLRAEQTSGLTTVEAVESDAAVRLTTAEQMSSLMALMLALVVVSALAGLVLANRLTRPVLELAESAQMLGRGRFDIPAPRSKIPEIKALGAALQASAQQLRRTIHRDREYIQHTSHILRTPLTGLRLELEEALLADDLDDDVRRSLTRCLKSVGRMQETVAELVDFERTRGLVDGAEVRMVDLGLQMATHWRDKLPSSRPLRTFVDAGEDLGVTPGPIEQLLDHVFEDVSRNGTGEVALHFEAAESHLRVRVLSGPGRSGVLESERHEAHTAQTFTELMGGHWSGDALGDGLEILLPRR
jgi:signal transduction histidine kinase